MTLCSRPNQALHLRPLKATDAGALGRSPTKEVAMPRHISEKRKIAYYVGMGLQVLGGLLFSSTFVTFLMHFGDFSNFQARAKSDGFRAFGGMALLVIGGIIRVIGAKGLAGSGVLLDPEKGSRRTRAVQSNGGGNGEGCDR